MVSPGTELPRGIRNNNPGNIIKGDIPWKGMVHPGNDPRFCTFDTMRNGVRALAVVLIGYQIRHHLRTIEEYIERWAPPNENNTEAYVKAVSEFVKANPHYLYDLIDPHNLLLLVQAIIRQENGPTYNSINAQDITYGCLDAIQATLGTEK